MLRWQLIVLAVGATVPDSEITAAGAEFLKKVLQEAEKKQTEKYTLITDASENGTALGDMFEIVGNGYCVNSRHTRIHSSITYQSKQDPVTRENKKCEAECRFNDQCVGYDSMETYCELIRVNDKYLDGGITWSNQKDGVTCFRKKGVPVYPPPKNFWKTLGKVILAAMVLSAFAVVFYFVVMVAIYLFAFGN
eukprot:GEMP01056770.1.p1 GENE.GEMP01056770.1~~GEMP01056770.1.p1  ORF type:complete len:193 (+),score=43.69 GEMP01056770.1:87-665(+)